MVDMDIIIWLIGAVAIGMLVYYAAILLRSNH